MKGRHTSENDGRRWAPNARHAALSVAPIAALLIAVGAGGAGLLTGRADLAAAGAAVGGAGVVIEQVSSRSNRRRLRQDRGAMKARIRELDALVAELTRELAGLPSVLRPEPPPPPATGPLPLVSASDRAAGPATPRSLPILTANRRGLQSCAPELPGLPVPALSAFGVSGSAAPGTVAALAGSVGGPVGVVPGQRPPATPITGLNLPPVEDPSLPKLTPGPAAPVVRQLDPGPRQPLTGRRGRHSSWSGTGEPREGGVHDLALIGAALHAERAEPRERGLVVDIRSVPASAPVTATMSGASPAEVDGLVFAAIAQARADDFTIALEQPARRAVSLFEQVVRSGSGRARADAVRAPSGPVAVDDDELRRLAGTARTASRAMRPSPPPSPFFTPGAFEAEAPRRESA